MTYAEYVEKYIEQQPMAAPIFTTEISKKMEECFQIPRAKAAAATSVAVKRIMDRNTIPTLRFYQKGVYYNSISIKLYLIVHSSSSGKLD